MSDIKSFSLFEGEVIVAEGFNDSNSRFNVSKIYKPQINPPGATEVSLIKHAAELQQNRALHVIVAAGPFTTLQDLMYQPLRDLLDLVKRDKPHVLILMGPFLDAKSQDLQDGDIYYTEPGGE